MARLSAIVWGVVFFAVITAPAVAYAQRGEAGGLVTYFDLGSLDQTAWGGGGRIGVALFPGGVAEGEVSVFAAGDRVTGAMTQVLGGLKLGGGGRGYGLFVKLRPGLVRFADDFIPPGTVCVAVVPTPEACLNDRVNFALDVGSVIELYPSGRTILRVDLGTTYVWYGSRGESPTRRSGNFQLSLGAGLRF